MHENTEICYLCLRWRRRHYRVVQKADTHTVSRVSAFLGPPCMLLSSKFVLTVSSVQEQARSN